MFSVHMLGAAMVSDGQPPDKKWTDWKPKVVEIS